MRNVSDLRMPFSNQEHLSAVVAPKVSEFGSMTVIVGPPDFNLTVSPMLKAKDSLPR